METEMTDYSNLTNEEYDEILEELVEEEPAGILLGIPGVYEAVREHYNNEVLEKWERRQEAEKPGE
jgi:hypothetical protein